MLIGYTNMVLVPGLQIYDPWKERAISPTPKDESHCAIDRAWPLVFLETRKICNLDLEKEGP